jgi:hypothetical protein
VHEPELTKTEKRLARRLLKPGGNEEAFMGSSRDPRPAVQLHEEEVAEAILQYLAEHSQAMDTLAGIAEWWIPRQRVRMEVNTLTRVLKRLSDEGLLECQGTGENALYRLKKRDTAPPSPADDP